MTTDDDFVTLDISFAELQKKISSNQELMDYLSKNPVAAEQEAAVAESVHPLADVVSEKVEWDQSMPEFTTFKPQPKDNTADIDDDDLPPPPETEVRLRPERPAPQPPGAVQNPIATRPEKENKIEGDE